MGRVPRLARAEPVELDPLRIAELIELGGLLATLVATFRATTSAEVPKLATALAQGDAAAVRRLSHGLAGCAANLGAAELAAVFATIEHHAMRGDLTPVPELVAAAAERLERTHRELEALTARLG